jgi:hypothetical protein
MSTVVAALSGHPFDTIKYQPDGLSLSICGCSGKTKYFVPHKLIHYISAGRLFYIKTLIVGVVLLAVGIYSKSKHDSLGDWGTIALIIGGLMSLWCLIMMIQQSLTIHTKEGDFYSTKCCNSMSEVVTWYRSANSTHGIRAHPAVLPDLAFTDLASANNFREDQQLQSRRGRLPASPSAAHTHTWTNSASAPNKIELTGRTSVPILPVVTVDAQSTVSSNASIHSFVAAEPDGYLTSNPQASMARDC